MSYVRWIWHFWQPHRPWILVLAFLTLLSSAVVTAYPLVIMYLIDTLKEKVDQNDPAVAYSTTWTLVGVMVAIGLSRTIANLYPGFRAMINSRIEMGVREHYFSQIVEKGYRFFLRFRTGDLVTRLTDDIGGFPKIAWFCCSGVFRAVESSSKFIFCMVAMLLINWKLALLSITPLPVMLWIFYMIRLKISKRAMERQQIMSVTNEALEAAFSGIRILKAFRSEANQSHAFQHILDKRIEVELSLTRLWFGTMQIYWGIQFAGQIIVIVAGGIMVLGDSLSVGAFYAFYMFLSMILQPLMDIPNLFVTSRQAFACIDREIEIEQTAGGTEESFKGTAPVEQIDEIALKEATFSYDEGLAPALSDISLELKRGTRVAIVGPVGSGKSTLLKAVAGILPIAEGSIQVNGQRLSEFDIQQYRKRIGYVPQEATLFSESVADNISFGRELDREAIGSALKLAQVHQEMKALPGGIDEVLGQRGMTVSGGQKQRLAIARALAAKPDLLLMDDCTSALDSENERAFWLELKEHNPQATCLIVTHRLATARQADVIFVLAGGRIVGQGTHEELLNCCEEYRSFMTKKELEAALNANAG